MKDKWMNIGFEEDELKPYNEPLPDLNDQMRIGEFVLTISKPLFFIFIILFSTIEIVEAGIITF